MGKNKTTNGKAIMVEAVLKAKGYIRSGPFSMEKVEDAKAKREADFKDNDDYLKYANGLYRNTLAELKTMHTEAKKNE